MAEGSWIFLSHSHKDFDKVRDVRNILEEQGHHPLMFFLKCLNDEDEIDDLIRREIEARSWFILCDSENARNSTWVQEEIEIINRFPNKTCQKIALYDPAVNLEKEISKLTRKASVFLTFTRHDRDFADKLKMELRSKDFGIFSALELLKERDWRRKLDSELVRVSRLGTILLVVSVKSVQTDRQKKEVESAAKIHQKGAAQSNVVIVFRENPDKVLKMAALEMRDAFQNLQWADFSERSFQENLDALMMKLREHDWSG